MDQNKYPNVPQDSPKLKGGNFDKVPFTLREVNSSQPICGAGVQDINGRKRGTKMLVKNSFVVA